MLSGGRTAGACAVQYSTARRFPDHPRIVT
jgi:hypothetical protein